MFLSSLSVLAWTDALRCNIDGTPGDCQPDENACVIKKVNVMGSQMDGNRCLRVDDTDKIGECEEFGKAGSPMVR